MKAVVWIRSPVRMTRATAVEIRARRASEGESKGKGEGKGEESVE